MTLTFGIEIETYRNSVSIVQSALHNNGIKGCLVKPDGTPSVDAEIVLPPITLCQVGKEYLESVCTVLSNADCRINQSCGLHVHIGNAPLADTTHAARFTGDSILHTERTGRFLSEHGDTFEFPIVKDLNWRWERQQNIINGMFPRSRTNNRYCKPLNATKIENANTISELNHGKFYAINLDTWRNGTIEFRQHSGTIEADKIWRWMQFLDNFVNWTIEARVEQGNRSTTIETPIAPFRNGSRVGVQYTMMRNDNGVSTREIMDATGCSEQRVRAAVSEIRQRVGDNAVVTHTQQSNGARYGDGTDLTRYQVLQTIESETNGVTLLPENRIGIPSIWAGLDDSEFEHWQNRISALR
jgi:hypothetical protein